MCHQNARAPPLRIGICASAGHFFSYLGFYKNSIVQSLNPIVGSVSQFWPISRVAVVKKIGQSNKFDWIDSATRDFQGFRGGATPSRGRARTHRPRTDATDRRPNPTGEHRGRQRTSPKYRRYRDLGNTPSAYLLLLSFVLDEECSPMLPCLIMSFTSIDTLN